MTRTKEPNGQILAAWELARIEERNLSFSRAACMWCDWTLEDTLAETREAHREHRSSAHPEVKVRKQIRRKRLFGTMSTHAQLRDNIANARAQGGAVWAGPDAE